MAEVGDPHLDPKRALYAHFQVQVRCLTQAQHLRHEKKTACIREASALPNISGSTNSDGQK